MIEDVVDKYNPLFKALLKVESYLDHRELGCDDNGGQNAHQFLMPYNQKGYYQLFWTLRPMINCCGICVLTNISSPSQALPLILDFSVEAARALGYGQLLLTDIAANLRQALKERRWRFLTEFRNPRSGNEIYMASKSL